MRQEWHIKLTGKQRKELDKDLLIQALIALERQFQMETAQTNRDSADEPQKGVASPCYSPSSFFLRV
jgi:hypothetical protein